MAGERRVSVVDGLVLLGALGGVLLAWRPGVVVSAVLLGGLVVVLRVLEGLSFRGVVRLAGLVLIAPTLALMWLDEPRPMAVGWMRGPERLLVARQLGEVVEVVDARSGERVFREPTSSVPERVFGAGNLLVLWSGEDVRAWDIGRATPVRAGVQAIARDGERWLTGSGEVRTTRAPGASGPVVEGAMAGVFSAAGDAAGDVLFIGMTEEGGAVVGRWQARAGARRVAVPEMALRPGLRVRSVGEHLVLVGGDAEVRRVDPGTGEVVARLSLAGAPLAVTEAGLLCWVDGVPERLGWDGVARRMPWTGPPLRTVPAVTADGARMAWVEGGHVVVQEVASGARRRWRAPLEDGVRTIGAGISVLWVAMLTACWRASGRE